MTTKLAAEFLGTFWLVLGGCGSAVLAAGFPDVGIGLLGVSLAFGLTVVTGAYTFGPISGGHFNPAVSVGLCAGGRFPKTDLIPYIVAQTAGVRYDGKRVSLQPSRGEHVNLNEAVAAFAIIPRCFRTLSDRLKSSRETSSPNRLNKASTVELVLHKQPPPIIAASKGLGRINLC